MCEENFLSRIERLAKAGPDAILLREKDLPEEEYRLLAASIIPLCEAAGVPLIVHTHTHIARELGISRIHLPYERFLAQQHDLQGFSQIGVSVHSREEAVNAQAAGASCLIAGHIFPTACKEGLPPRGLAFLQAVCAAVDIPVYAIGGITAEKIPLVVEQGAAGGCVMSAWMRCESLREAVFAFRRACI